MLPMADSDVNIADSLKHVLRQMPSPVAIVSVTDPQTLLPCGLAITAYAPVSMDPPSMQICINRSAGAYSAILAAGVFSVNILGATGQDVLRCFSDPQKKSERFADGHQWQLSEGIPYLPTSNAVIFCKTVATHDFGTHTLVIGVVEKVSYGAGAPPAVWLGGRLHTVEAS